MSRHHGPNSRGAGRRPALQQRGRAEDLIGHPIGPPLPAFERPDVLPVGAVGVQPWGTLPAKPPLRARRPE